MEKDLPSLLSVDEILDELIKETESDPDAENLFPAEPTLHEVDRKKRTIRYRAGKPGNPFIEYVIRGMGREDSEVEIELEKNRYADKFSLVSALQRSRFAKEAGKKVGAPVKTIEQNLLSIRNGSIEAGIMRRMLPDLQDAEQALLKVEELKENRNRFIGYLRSLVKRNDRAAIAQLRRNLSKPPNADMFRLVMPYVPAGEGWVADRQRDVFFLIAALFSSHPDDGGFGNLGNSFKKALGHDSNESQQRQFVVLLDCKWDMLPRRLATAVLFLKSKGVSIHWNNLLTDLLYWEVPGRPRQMRWARMFWGRAERTEEKREDKEKKGPGNSGDVTGK